MQRKGRQRDLPLHISYLMRVMVMHLHVVIWQLMHMALQLCITPIEGCGLYWPIVGHTRGYI